MEAFSRTCTTVLALLSLTFTNNPLRTHQQHAHDSYIHHSTLLPTTPSQPFTYSRPSILHPFTHPSTPTLFTSASPVQTTPFTPSLCALPTLTLVPGFFTLHTKILVSSAPLTALLASLSQAMLVTRPVWDDQRVIIASAKLSTGV